MHKPKPSSKGKDKCKDWGHFENEEQESTWIELPPWPLFDISSPPGWKLAVSLLDDVSHPTHAMIGPLKDQNSKDPLANEDRKPILDQEIQHNVYKWKISLLFSEHNQIKLNR